MPAGGQKAKAPAFSGVQPTTSCRPPQQETGLMVPLRWQTVAKR